MKTHNRIYKGSIAAIAFILLISFGSDVAEAKLFQKNRHGAAQAVTSRDNSLPATQTSAFNCLAPVYARVKFSLNPNSNFGVRNWGTGDLAKKVFVGGGSDSNKYSNSQWFKIYDGGNPIIDQDIENYDNVKGLAVQRMDGAIRVALHGSWTEPDNNPLANRERAEGVVQFSHDGKNLSTMVLPTAIVGDTTVNQLDYSPNKGTNHPQDDRIMLHNNGTQGYFKMVVTTNDDGFYVHYALPAQCK